MLSEPEVWVFGLAQLAPNRRAGQILILGFYLDNFRDKNRRKIVKTGARNEKTAQKSKSKSRAGFILILGSKWRRFGARPIEYRKALILGYATMRTKKLKMENFLFHMDAHGPPFPKKNNICFLWLPKTFSLLVWLHFVSPLSQRHNLSC